MTSKEISFGPNKVAAAERGLREGSVLALQAEIERLHMTLDQQGNNWNAQHQLDLKEIDRLRADAARYRWLRTANWLGQGMCVVETEYVKYGSPVLREKRLDDRIDAALAHETGG